MNPALIPTKPRDASIHVRDALVAAVVATALFAGRGLAQTPSESITVGETFVIPSVVMREDRRVMISLPESYRRIAIAT